MERLRPKETRPTDECENKENGIFNLIAFSFFIITIILIVSIQEWLKIVFIVLYLVLAITSRIKKIDIKSFKVGIYGISIPIMLIFLYLALRHYK